MPRYFFHVHDRRDLPDEDGADLLWEKALG